MSEDGRLDDLVRRVEAGERETNERLGSIESHMNDWRASSDARLSRIETSVAELAGAGKTLGKIGGYIGPAVLGVGAALLIPLLQQCGRAPAAAPPPAAIEFSDPASSGGE